MKRGTPPMTQYFWAYGTVESDPHSLFLIHEIRKILLKNYKIIISIKLDNIKKYELVKKKL